MHLKTWLRIADLKEEGEIKPEDRKELVQTAEVVKRYIICRGDTSRKGST